MLQHSH
ncbi:hypothetical protein F383_04082 [Gossypium arboreum]|nr:hypothetical protein F383_04082 [Gossypium arboreum]